MSLWEPKGNRNDCSCNLFKKKPFFFLTWQFAFLFIERNCYKLLRNAALILMPVSSCLSLRRNQFIKPALWPDKRNQILKAVFKKIGLLYKCYHLSSCLFCNQHCPSCLTVSWIMPMQNTWGRIIYHFLAFRWLHTNSPRQKKTIQI